jgi:hypothetical protein
MLQIIGEPALRNNVMEALVRDVHTDRILQERNDSHIRLVLVCEVDGETTCHVVLLLGIVVEV